MYKCPSFFGTKPNKDEAWCKAVGKVVMRLLKKRRRLNWPCKSLNIPPRSNAVPSKQQKLMMVKTPEKGPDINVAPSTVKKQMHISSILMQILI